MTKVAVTQSKLDSLAESIGVKSERRLPLTIDEMKEAVEGIEVANFQAVTISPSEAEQVLVPDAPHNGFSSVTVNAAPLEEWSVTKDTSGTTTYTPTSGYYGMKSVSVYTPNATLTRGIGSSGYTTLSGVRKWRVRPSTNTSVRGIIPTGIVYGEYSYYNAVPSGTTITPSTSAQTIGGANYMMEGAVTVNPIPSQYIVPSGTKSITSNGTGIDVTEYASVDVAVPSSSGSVTQDANGYIVLPETGGGGGGGGSTANWGDPIRFFDYDGTLVASYTAVPASLPSVPTHTGLTNGTWNYTLPQVTTQFNAMGTCDVGANYTTSSGATEIDIVLQEGRLHPYLSLAVNGTVSIDWGDNSTPDTSTGTSLTSRKNDIHHEYAQAGSYTIKISKTSGTGYALYCTSTYVLLNAASSTANSNLPYANTVKSVRVGEYCTIGQYAFYACFSLASVTLPSGISSIGIYAFQVAYSLKAAIIPSGISSIGNNLFSNCYSLSVVSMPTSVTSIGNNAFASCESLFSISISSAVSSFGTSAFSSCRSLKNARIPNGVTSLPTQLFSGCNVLEHAVVPNNVTSIGNQVFNGCTAMTSVTISNSVTSIGNSVFNNNYPLTKLTIPASVTSIGTYAFSGCYGMAEYHFMATTPPTLSDINAFQSIPSDCIIYVPSSKLNDYKTAENWSTYADYMVGE